MIWLALGILLITVVMFLDLLMGSLRLPRLEAATPAEGDDLPSISIVIAARDEVGQLEGALKSVLSLDYPRKEVRVVDDRSTDGTGALLDAMASRYPELRVDHLRELPPGWLGKNHALHYGAARATGEWLLFTDADVVMDPSALRRAMAIVRGRGLDHLAGLPEVDIPGALGKIALATFGVFFNAFTRPWGAENPKSRYFIGIGAFNLVRRSAFEAVGGLAPIALRPDDDVRLGKLLKDSGYRQTLAMGPGLLRVRWYETVGGMVHGLEKNTYAGLDYYFAAFVASVLAVLVLNLWPVAAVFVLDGTLRGIYGAVVVLQMAHCVVTARANGLPLWTGPCFPLGALMFAYMLVNGTAKTIVNGGICWRDTFYPLAELRKNRRLLPR